MTHPAARLVPIAFASFAMACCLALPGQDDGQEQRAPTRLTPKQIAADLPFRLDAGEMHLTDLVNRVAEQLGRNYLYDPRELAPDQNLITLQTAMLFDDPDGLEVFLGRMLWSKGFVRVPFGNDEKTWEILSLQGPRRGEVASRARQMTADQVLAIREHYLPVQCAVPLANLHPQHAANALRPFFASSSNGGAQLTTMGLGDEGPILLHGLAPQVAAAIDLVRDADAAATKQSTNLEQRIDALSKQLHELVQQVAALRATASKGDDAARRNRDD